MSKIFRILCLSGGVCPHRIVPPYASPRSGQTNEFFPAANRISARTLFPCKHQCNMYPPLGALFTDTLDNALRRFLKKKKKKKTEKLKKHCPYGNIYTSGFFTHLRTYIFSFGFLRFVYTLKMYERDRFSTEI